MVKGPVGPHAHIISQARCPRSVLINIHIYRYIWGGPFNWFCVCDKPSRVWPCIMGNAIC